MLLSIGNTSSGASCSKGGAIFARLLVVLLSTGSTSLGAPCSRGGAIFARLASPGSRWPFLFHDTIL